MGEIPYQGSLHCLMGEGSSLLRGRKLKKSLTWRRASTSFSNALWATPVQVKRCWKYYCFLSYWPISIKMSKRIWYWHFNFWHFFFFYICLQITNAKYFIIQNKVSFNSVIISSLLSQTDYQYLYWYAYVNLIKLLIIDPYTCIGVMLFKFSIPFFYPYIIIFSIS